LWQVVATTIVVRVSVMICDPINLLDGFPRLNPPVVFVYNASTFKFYDGISKERLLMNRFLMIDVGAGTMDILYVDMESGAQYKAVVASPVRTIASSIEKTPGNLLVTGCEMGGGPVSQVLIRRAGESRVVMSAPAAATLHHDLEKVRSWNIEVVEDEKVTHYQKKRSFSHVTLGDLEPARLDRIVKGFGVPFKFDVVCFCAQDHGIPPTGESHLDFRHRKFRARLDRHPFPHILLFEKDEIPEELNRLRSAALVASTLPTQEIYVMDSGMAAILGASTDLACTGKKRLLVMDVATSHTVVGALENGEIAGIVEYHTHDLTRDRLEELIVDLSDGRLSHEAILEEGGHGAYIRKPFGYANGEILLATGPKRELIGGSKLPIVWGAPLGDNMMTGTAGLLQAVCRRKHLDMRPSSSP